MPVNSQISYTFLFQFSTKFLVIRAETRKMLIRIANREDPDQTTYSERPDQTALIWVYTVCQVVFFDRQQVFETFKHLCR